ncbi:MAG: hypothetical protein PHF64_00190 [Methanoregula sp.]|jgi:hypothetical protein|nr:hypothetical protein [Methanoregula sp.]
MTRDEVMALSDEELNDKAIDLAGWEYEDELSMTLRQGWHHREFGYRGTKPDYPHDIAAAMDLWEAMAQYHRVFHLCGPLSPPAAGWRIDQEEQYDLVALSWGETPSLTITRAFVIISTGGADASK